MPVRKSFASQKLMQCPDVPIETRLEAARYLLRWAGENNRPRFIYEASTFIFQYSTDQDEKLDRALHLLGSTSTILGPTILVGPSTIPIEESTQLKVAKWMIQNLEEGSTDYDLAGTRIVQLDPTSQLAIQLVQYLYRTAIDDLGDTTEAVEAIQEEPSLHVEPEKVERVSRYTREPVI